jgi:hypothetical protein
VIVFEEEGHRYFSELGGVRRELPSVSSLLDGRVDRRFFRPWHGERGRAVHRMVALDVQKALDLGTLDPALRPFLDNWHAFVDATDFRVINIELIVGREDRYGFAGRLDLTGVFPRNAREVVLDVKSGAKAPTHDLQVAGYVLGHGGDRWRDLDGAVLYLGGKRPDYRPIPFLRLSECVTEFEKLVRDHWETPAVKLFDKLEGE